MSIISCEGRQARQSSPSQLDEALVVSTDITGDDVVRHRAAEQVVGIIDEIHVVEVVRNLLGIPFDIDSRDLQKCSSRWMA